MPIENRRSNPSVPRPPHDRQNRGRSPSCSIRALGEACRALLSLLPSWQRSSGALTARIHASEQPRSRPTCRRPRYRYRLAPTVPLVPRCDSADTYVRHLATLLVFANSDSDGVQTPPRRGSYARRRPAYAARYCVEPGWRFGRSSSQRCVARRSMHFCVGRRMRKPAASRAGLLSAARAREEPLATPASVRQQEP